MKIFKYPRNQGLFENMKHSEDDTMDHPGDQLLEDYLRRPEAAEFGELRLHLAGCRHCRRRTELTAMLREQGHRLESEAPETDPQLADLVAGRLDASSAQRLRQEIRQDPNALRAALHYASHARDMHELGVSPVRGGKPRAGLSGLLQRLMTFEAPVWQMVPALAVVMTVAILLFNQLQPGQDGGQARIVAFQDNPMLRFASHETQPGIGFFSQQGVDAEPFGGMRVELLAHNRLRLSWPEIPGAAGYNLKLQVFRDGESRVLARRTLDSTVVELEFDERLSQHRYEWVLSGHTVDKRSFQSNGGFVISRN